MFGVCFGCWEFGFLLIVLYTSLVYVRFGCGVIVVWIMFVLLCCCGLLFVWLFLIFVCLLDMFVFVAFAWFACVFTLLCYVVNVLVGLCYCFLWLFCLLFVFIRLGLASGYCGGLVVVCAFMFSLRFNCCLFWLVGLVFGCYVWLIYNSVATFVVTLFGIWFDCLCCVVWLFVLVFFGCCCLARWLCFCGGLSVSFIVFG